MTSASHPSLAATAHLVESERLLVALPLVETSPQPSRAVGARQRGVERRRVPFSARRAGNYRARRPGLGQGHLIGDSQTPRPRRVSWASPVVPLGAAPSRRRGRVLAIAASIAHPGYGNTAA